MNVLGVLDTLACTIINFDLSSEQVEEMADVVKEETRLSWPNTISTLVSRILSASENASAPTKQISRRTTEANNHLAKYKRYSDKQKESKAFYCDLCDHASTKP